MCCKYNKLEESYNHTEYNRIDKTRQGRGKKKKKKNLETAKAKWHIIYRESRYCVSRVLIRHNAWWENNALMSSNTELKIKSAYYE